MSPSAPLRVLIIDDEPLARQRIEDLLKKVPGVDVVGSADNGRDGIELIRKQRPDLVFLDIQMPSTTGIDVVREVGPEEMPVTIFVTAYDQYALDAFEFAALDYLLKPFDDERFHQALERARRMINLREIDAARGRLLQLLSAENASGEPQDQKAPGYLERIAVEMRGQVRVVPVEEIEYITASGPYAELHVGKDTYLIREQMQALEDRLDPHDFLRIHRSTIVRIDLVESFIRNAGGDYAVKLKSGRRLKVSRGRREELENRLGLDTL